MKIYHIDRDYNLTLKEQKKLIKLVYKNVVEIISEGQGKLMVFAD